MVSATAAFRWHVLTGNGMGSNGHYRLLAFNMAAAIAGALVMMAIVYWDVLESASDEAETGVSASGEPANARLAFVRPGTLIQQPPAHQSWSSTIEASAEGEPSWSTEIQRERTEPGASPRFSLLPSLRLPWQKPAPPQRTHTLKTRLAEIGPGATQRLAAKFETAKAQWPPAEMALLAIKSEKALELHVRQKGGPWKLIHRYRVLAASGGPGPKLRQGDKQVPEGIYSIAFLNPNSAYHVSLRVNYPNAFDREMAAKEARKDLGGDIMIHGKNLSAGCLAVGDEAAEELFVLAAQTGLAHVKVIIAPTDFRDHAIPPSEPGRPEWLPKLYTEVASAMSELKDREPRSAATSLLSFFSR